MIKIQLADWLNYSDCFLNELFGLFLDQGFIDGIDLSSGVLLVFVATIAKMLCIFFWSFLHRSYIDRVNLSNDVPLTLVITLDH